MTGTAGLLLNDGVPDSNTAISAVTGKNSPRRIGIKQGIFMILLMIVLAPVLGLIFRFGLDMMPWPMGVLVFLLGGGGLLRIVYALLFESKYTDAPGEAEKILKLIQMNRELPAGDTTSYIPPESSRAGEWLETRDLQPHSVTDRTTKLLEKEQD